MTSAAELNQVFLASIVPENGYTGVTAWDPETNKMQMSWIPYANKDAREAYIKRHPDRNLYFSPASYSKKRRVKDYAICNRVIFLDIDAGEVKVKKHGLDKVYKDYDTALAAYTDWISSCGPQVPGPSWVIRSGEGLHIYWHIKEEISIAEWEALEHGLCRFAASGGLLLDSSVVHSNSLLRLPGSLHQGAGQVVTIQENLSTKAPYNYMDLCSAFPPVAPTVASLPTSHKSSPNAPTLSPRPAHLSEVNAEELWPTPALRKDPFRPLLQASLNGEGCPFLAHAYTEQETLSEGLWRAALSIAVNCSDGPEMIHEISHRHRDYDARATEKKAAACHDKPFLCETIGLHSPEHCASCAFKGKVKSPIAIHVSVPIKLVSPEEYQHRQQDLVHQKRRTSTRTTSTRDSNPAIAMRAILEKDITKIMTTSRPVPVMPSAYGISEYNQLVRIQGGTEKEIIFPRPVYAVQRQISHTEGDVLIYIYDSPHDGAREIQLPTGDIPKPERVLSTFASHGVIPTTEVGAKNMVSYLRMSAANMQETPGIERTNHYGWQADMSFMLGDARFTKGDPERASVVGASAYRDALSARATADPHKWGEMAQHFMGEGFEPAMLAIGLSAGAPLFRMIDRRGAMLHLYSAGTGRGKTTIVKLALNIWGRADANANGHGLMGVSQDTSAARFSRLSMLGSIPSGLDELTKQAPDDVADFLYAFTHGRQRERMTGSSNQLRENTATWDAGLLSTGNTMISDALRDLGDIRSATQARVLELDCSSLPVLEGLDVESMRMNIEREHAGAVGRALAYYVTHYYDAVVTLMKGVDEELAGLGLSNSTERFWTAMVRCSYGGLVILRSLGLITPDLDRLREYIRQVLTTARRNQRAAEKQADRLLEDYLAEHTLDQLVVQHEEQSVPDHELPRFIVSKYVKTTGLLAIAKRPFEKWLTEHGYSVTGMEYYMSSLNASVKRYSMLPASSGRMTRQNCWVIPHIHLSDNVQGKESLPTSASQFAKDKRGLTDD